MVLMVTLEVGIAVIEAPVRSGSEQSLLPLEPGLDALSDSVLQQRHLLETELDDGQSA